MDNPADPLHHASSVADDTGVRAPINGSYVGVIALGSMGARVARSLLRAGFAVRVCDVRPAVVQSVVEASAIAYDVAVIKTFPGIDLPNPG